MTSLCGHLTFLYGYFLSLCGHFASFLAVLCLIVVVLHILIDFASFLRLSRFLFTADVHFLCQFLAIADLILVVLRQFHSNFVSLHSHYASLCDHFVFFSVTFCR